MMKMLLKKFGVEADTAENGRAAVDMISLSPDPYQLVLMDNLMPEMVKIDHRKEENPVLLLCATSFH